MYEKRGQERKKKRRDRARTVRKEGPKKAITRNKKTDGVKLNG